MLLLTLISLGNAPIKSKISINISLKFLLVKTNSGDSIPLNVLASAVSIAKIRVSNTLSFNSIGIEACNLVTTSNNNNTGPSII